MMDRHIEDKNEIINTKKIFLQSYFNASGIDINESMEKRIETYYHWTALRTTIFFLVKEYPEPERAQELIDKLRKNLAI